MFNQLKLSNVISKVSLVAVILFLTGCGNGVIVKTSLNNTRDVKEGADVFLEQEIVGEVTDVTHSDGQTLLTIELDEATAANVKQNAAIVVNRLKTNSPIEIYNQKANAEAVQSGQELKGLDSMFQLGAWMVGDTLDIGADSLTGYVNAFQKYLQGDAWQQNKKVIIDQAQQAATVAEETIKQAAKEMEKISAEFGKIESEVATAVEQIGNDLAPVFGELAKSGQSIVQELEKFSQNLEQKDDDEKAVGTDFIRSLEKALETLNRSIEEGVSEPHKLDQANPTESAPSNSNSENVVKESEGLSENSIEASEKIVEDLIQEFNNSKPDSIEQSPSK